MQLHKYPFGFAPSFASIGYTSALDTDLFNVGGDVMGDLMDQENGAHGFDYEACSYDGRTDVHNGDLIAALDLSVFSADDYSLLVQQECTMQFTDLIYQEFCRPIERETGCKPQHSMAAFSKAYTACYKAFENSKGAVHQLIRAAHALDCYGKDADLLGLLGAQNFAALKGMQALATEFALLEQARAARR